MAKQHVGIVFMIITSFHLRTKAQQERAIEGLTRHQAPKVIVREVPGKGRAVFTTAPISKFNYVMEYKSHRVYPHNQRLKFEKEYELNEEPCMILEAQTNQGWICIDATRRVNTLGRLLNHSIHPNLKPFRPLMIDRKWRVAFMATHNISPGKELTWDYGSPPHGINWLMRVRQKPTSAAHDEVHFLSFLTKWFTSLSQFLPWPYSIGSILNTSFCSLPQQNSTLLVRSARYRLPLTLK